MSVLGQPGAAILSNVLVQRDLTALEAYIRTFEGPDMPNELSMVGICEPVLAVVGAPSERLSEQVEVRVRSFMRSGRTADLWLMFSMGPAPILGMLRGGAELWIPLSAFPVVTGTKR